MKRYIVCLSVCLSTYTHPFNGPLSGTTRVSRYQKGKTNLDFTEARDSEWQWHWLGHMRVCTLLQTTMPAPHHSVFLQAGCPSCRPTNSIKALSVYLLVQKTKLGQLSHPVLPRWLLKLCISLCVVVTVVVIKN